MSSLKYSAQQLMIIFLHVVAAVKEATWDEAYSTCKQKGMVLTPLRSLQLSSSLYSPNKTIWTSTYTLCVGRLMGLYVEELNISEQHRGFCLKNETIVVFNEPRNYTQQDFICSWDYGSRPHPHSLLNISSLKTFEEAIDIMQMDMKYWINDIDLNFSSFVRHCEEHAYHANSSFSARLQGKWNNCANVNKYECLESRKKQHRTAVSLVQLHPTVCEGLLPRNNRGQKELSTEADMLVWQILTLAFSIAVFIGVILSCCLVRKWIVSLQREVQTLQQQSYIHPMYNSEGVQVIQSRTETETEPSTPVSINDSAFYENVAEDARDSEDTNLTVTYATSTKVRRTVEVARMLDKPMAEQNGCCNHSTPQISSSVRMLSRTSAVRHKSMVNDISGRKMKKRLTSRQISTEPYSSRRTNPIQFNKLGMPDEWFQTEGTIQACKSHDKANYVNQPSPQPCTKKLQNMADFGPNKRRSRSENNNYINSGNAAQFGNSVLSDEEDYENIWQNTL